MIPVWTFMFVYVFLYILDFMWAAELDGFWDNIILDASTIMKYYPVYF